LVEEKIAYKAALEDFRRERSKASLQGFWANITGKSLNLFKYDEISEKLRATSKSERGLQNIKLKDIVGSVGRYHDFNRNFLPLVDNDMHRWASVKTAMVGNSGIGVPPISVYKLGDAYFVLDGNHRVSIAKQMGFDQIEAYVTEIKTKASFSPFMSPLDLIIEEEYLKFLDETLIEKILPEINLKLTFTNLYDLLKEHINVHRYYMGIEQNRPIPYKEGLVHWYETVYLPVVTIIRDLGVLRSFPEQTETDMYLWILDHQTQLQEEYGLPIRTDLVADDLAKQEGKKNLIGENKGLHHIEEILEESISESTKDDGLLRGLRNDNLVNDMLVTLSGLDTGWLALEQAIIFSNLVGGKIRGLHIKNEKEEDSEHQVALNDEFTKRLALSGKSGTLSFSTGEISTAIVRHARLSDLLVLKLTYPPSASVFDRMSSGFTTIARKLEHPILVVGEQVTIMNSHLLAYDGSPKSKEALIIAAYLAARWNSPLTIITVDDGSLDLADAIANAKAYLSKLGIQYNYHISAGKFEKEVLLLVDELKVDFLLLGGYRNSSFFDVIFGSSVDPILRGMKIPVLLC
jgi:nucleotide-binding universal stress UspA family protein